MMDHVPLTAPDLSSLHVGCLVIAVYPEDGRRYRAKVEEVGEKGEERVFRVRYIDYGNVSQVGLGDLFQWDPVLEVIPPQAFCCRLRESKMMFKKPIIVRTSEAARFLLLMKVWSPFQMVVSKVRRLREKMFTSRKCQEPEIVVDLIARDGILVSKKLSCSSLKHLLRKVDVSSLNSTSSPSVNITSDSCLISSSCGPPSETLKPLEKVRLWMQMDQIGKEKKMKVSNKESSVKPQKNACVDDIEDLVGFQEESVEFRFSDEQKRILEHLKRSNQFQAKKTVIMTSASTKVDKITKVKNSNAGENEKEPTNTYKSKTKHKLIIKTQSLRLKPVCVFFLGEICKFGQKCRFRHEKPNSNPVKTLDTLIIPAVGTTVVVWVSHGGSPSHFYINFPYGATSISGLTEKQRKACPRRVPQKKRLVNDMISHYKDDKQFNFDSVPTQGSLVAVKERKYWVRARVTSEIDKHGKVEVFLLDDGRSFKVKHVDLRKLDSKFTSLPSQVKEACIHGLRPVGSSWHREARRRMLDICKDGDYLSAKIVAIAREKLVVELRVHKGGKSRDVGQALCRSQLAAKREVESIGK